MTAQITDGGRATDPRRFDGDENAFQLPHMRYPSLWQRVAESDHAPSPARAKVWLDGTSRTVGNRGPRLIDHQRSIRAYRAESGIIRAGVRVK